MRRIILAGLLAGTVTLSGCSSSPNFLVYKNAKHFYVTSKGSSMREVLCDSGDLANITDGSALPANLKKELFESICSTNKGNEAKERVLAVLESMTKEQRTSLKEAFVANGYQINIVANC